MVYEYPIDGRTFQGTRVSFSDENSENQSEEAAYNIVAAYPAGKTVDVHYDPLSPENSALVTGMTGRGSNATRGGIAIIILGLFLLYLAR